MLEISCSGTPFEIGFRHGKEGAALIRGSISFYKDFFWRFGGISWDEATDAAKKFLPYLERHVPHLVEEMRGVAIGADVPFPIILVLNTRTEISMGLMSDGCTCAGWRTKDFSVAGQNWDWDEGQKDNLLLLHIKPNNDPLHPKPIISQITEAGIIGKIGLNSSGVGVLLNAIPARGVNFEALPFHIGLRVALESHSRLEAISRLSSLRCGTSANFVIADRTGTTSLESTHTDIVRLDMVNGQLAHSNHFLAEHNPPIKESFEEPDSIRRIVRIRLLLANSSITNTQNGRAASKILEKIFEDEDNFPESINRKSSGDDDRSSTLFSIVLDLEAVRGVVRVGRPTECEEIIELNFSTRQLGSRGLARL